MKWVKVLYSGFLTVIMLVTVASCGVPDPVLPAAATVVPADNSTINASDSIVITFSASMDPGALTLSGDMEAESNHGVWSRTSQSNDTLTISPDTLSGLWTSGTRTLIINAVGANGAPLATLTLNYTVEEPVPTAVVVPADLSTIIGSDSIVILFSVAMDPSTLALTGDMATESDGGIWSTTTNSNDTLVIRPGSAWTGATDTLIVDVDSNAGVALSTLTLTYDVDVSVPIAIASPADGAAINNVMPIIISFTIEMNPATLQPLAGSMGIESDGGVWTSNSNPNDTLTISPVGAWSGGLHELVLDVDASNGIPLSTLQLDYTVDDAMPSVDSVSPVTGSAVNSGQSIEIVFSKSMDIASQMVSGSLWDNADPNVVWTTTTNPNDTLTISPATLWPEPTIDLTLDILDLVGNSLPTLSLSYIVDVDVPIITLLGNAIENVERGTAYVDAGATALDNVDGDISANIVVAGDVVDVNTVGTYIITYNVSDMAGNPAVQVSRTVNVTADVTIPVISLVGNATVNIERGTAYVDAGATALDSFDGDISGSIVTVNPVDVDTVGSYSVTYNVVDGSGNAAIEMTRTVNVTADVTIPVISLVGSAVVNIERGTAYVDAGASALDNFDGDISGSIITVNPVDVNVVGPYTVTYNVVDGSSNAAVQVSRTVNVTADVTIPTITLLGNAVVNIERGTAYVDAGATALDNFDGDISGSIVTVNPVDSTTVGTYMVTYNVSDNSGNAALQVTRTVNVTADVTIPVISLVGNAVENIERGTAYVDADATALDNFDGDISGSIVTVNPVDVNVVGPYTVTYNVVDSSGNAALQVTRTVNVTTDVTIPVISLIGNAVENIERGTAYVDAGATALDNFDGDISGSIITVNPVDVNVVGPYTVTYNVVDSSGNAALQVSRTVNVTADVTIPVISLVGNAVENIERGMAYVDAGASALDNFDGDISGSIVTVNPVDVNVVGPYTVTYNVVDSSGNAALQVTRTVNVTADVTIPVISLVGNAVENVERGTAYVDAGASALDNFDGDISGSIVTVNPVDVNVVGPYTVTYNVVDSSGNAALQVTRTVNVTADVTIPVITLLGVDPTVITQGSTYTDAGATALDNFDGDITGSIVVGGDAVDESTVVGTYVITYNVSDTTGNAAVQVTRTVNVQ